MPTINGRLGTALSAANTNVQLYQVSADAKFAAVTITVMNPTENEVNFRLAMSMTETPGAEDWITPVLTLGRDTIYETTSRCMSANERIIVNANAAGLVCRVEGLEEEFSPYAAVA